MLLLQGRRPAWHRRSALGHDMGSRRVALQKVRVNAPRGARHATVFVLEYVLVLVLVLLLELVLEYCLQR